MKSLTDSEWDILVPAPPLQQSRSYGAALVRLGARAERALLHNVPVQVITRRGLRMIHRPPPSICLAPLARHAGVTVATSTAAGILPLITARHHAEWDVSPTSEALRKALAPKWRGHLNSSECTDISEGHDAILQDLLNKDIAQGRARGYRNLGAAFLAAWRGERLILHVSRKGGMLAAMLFLIHGAAATYLIAWTSAEGRRIEAHRAMLWHAALLLRGRGVTRIDLGPVDAGNPGLAGFKLGTGARLVNLGPTGLVLPL
jgi:hypothetical protein